MDIDPILKKLAPEDQQKLKEFLGVLSSEQTPLSLDLTRPGPTNGGKSAILTVSKVKPAD